MSRWRRRPADDRYVPQCGDLVHDDRGDLAFVVGIHPHVARGRVHDDVLVTYVDEPGERFVDAGDVMPTGQHSRLIARHGGEVLDRPDWTEDPWDNPPAVPCSPPPLAFSSALR